MGMSTISGGLVHSFVRGGYLLGVGLVFMEGSELQSVKRRKHCLLSKMFFDKIKRRAKTDLTSMFCCLQSNLP